MEIKGEEIVKKGKKMPKWIWVYSVHNSYDISIIFYRK